MKKMLITSLVATFLLANSASAAACGHEGLFMGIGYSQFFSYAFDYQLNRTPPEKVKLTPGYGGSFTFGYDFKGTRWGLQMPFEYYRTRVNGDEWANQFGSTVEGILHLVEWQSGLDFHLVGGIGWSYLDEGQNYNRTRSGGITADFGPGFSYFFTRTEKFSGAVALEIPFRYMYYFGNRLSSNGTNVMAFPIRIGMQIGF